MIWAFLSVAKMLDNHFLMRVNVDGTIAGQNFVFVFARYLLHRNLLSVYVVRMRAGKYYKNPQFCQNFLFFLFPDFFFHLCEPGMIAASQCFGWDVVWEGIYIFLERVFGFVSFQERRNIFFETSEGRGFFLIFIGTQCSERIRIDVSPFSAQISAEKPSKIAVFSSENTIIHHSSEYSDYEDDCSNGLNSFGNDRVGYLEFPWKICRFYLIVTLFIFYFKICCEFFGLYFFCESFPWIEKPSRSGIFFGVIFTRRQIGNHGFSICIDCFVGESSPFTRIISYGIWEGESSDIIDWEIIDDLFSCDGSFVIGDGFFSDIFQNVSVAIFEDDFSARSKMDISSIGERDGKIYLKISWSEEFLRWWWSRWSARKYREKTFSVPQRGGIIAERTIILSDIITSRSDDFYAFGVDRSWRYDISIDGQEHEYSIVRMDTDLSVSCRSSVILKEYRSIVSSRGGVCWYVDRKIGLLCWPRSQAKMITPQSNPFGEFLIRMDKFTFADKDRPSLPPPWA